MKRLLILLVVSAGIFAVAGLVGSSQFVPKPLAPAFAQANDCDYSVEFCNVDDGCDLWADYVDCYSNTDENTESGSEEGASTDTYGGGDDVAGAGPG